MSDHIVTQLLTLLRATFPQVDLSGISLESDIKLLGIDSLDFVELIFEVEQAFNIEIPSEDLGSITTVQSIVTIIQKKLGVEA